MARRLSLTFMEDLKSGSLHNILEYIQNDYTLDLEIRQNYVNIYYRGGNILKISEKRANSYNYEFDKEYLNALIFPTLSMISDYKSTFEWESYFPMMKQAMDFYFNKHPKTERESQQLIVRENNYSSVSKSTDYFIIDIEYDNRDKTRFDLIAVEWPAETNLRKLSKGYKPTLVVIEMKCGDGALGGKSGLKKHVSDFEKFLDSSAKVSDFKKEMKMVFEQKRELGLLPNLSITKNKNAVTDFAEAIEFAFIFVNHNKKSSVLKREISGFTAHTEKYFIANFMGYGLYKHSLYDYANFIEHI